LASTLQEQPLGPVIDAARASLATPPVPVVVSEPPVLEAPIEEPPALERETVAAVEKPAPKPRIQERETRPRPEPRRAVRPVVEPEVAPAVARETEEPATADSPLATAETEDEEEPVGIPQPDLS